MSTPSVPGAPARIMIAAPSGRSGKTVITLGLLRALTRRGMVVQPFKKGPDFIDPGWHSVACGRTSRNLDRFFMSPEQICAVFEECSDGSDLSIIEAAMGLFDGLDSQGSCSSAEIAKITQTPVLLVMNTTRMTRTTAALVLGCQRFYPELQIVGVILNHVRGSRHVELIREAIEATCGIPVVGALPVDDRLHIPDRHLGLLSSEEAPAREELLDGIADCVCEHIDLDAILTLATVEDTAPLIPASLRAAPQPASTSQSLRAAPQPASTSPSLRAEAQPVSTSPSLRAEAKPERGNLADQVAELGAMAEAPPVVPKRPVPFVTSAPRIAVIRDAAFCFYYEENLQALQKQGAELVFVNSLEDSALPKDIRALYIGGGFPEVFAAQLQANTAFRASLKERIEADLSVYAEGGGLHFLGRTLTYQGGVFEMVGALPLDTVIHKQRQAHGYAVMESSDTLPGLPAGIVFTGHEHHHAQITNLDPRCRLAFTKTRGKGIKDGRDGICYKEVLAVHMHVNALASPYWPAILI